MIEGVSIDWQRHYGQFELGCADAKQMKRMRNEAKRSEKDAK
jgi:hypothetical protein